MARPSCLVALAALAAAASEPLAPEKAQEVMIKHAHAVGLAAAGKAAPGAPRVARGGGKQLVETAHPRLKEAFAKKAAPAAARAPLSRLGGRSALMTEEECEQTTSNAFQDPSQCFKPVNGYKCGSSCKAKTEVKTNEFCYSTFNEDNVYPCPRDALECYLFCDKEACVQECLCGCKNVAGFEDSTPQQCGSCGYVSQAESTINAPYDCLTCLPQDTLVVAFSDCSGLCVNDVNGRGVKLYQDAGLGTIEESACTAHINCYSPNGTLVDGKGVPQAGVFEPTRTQLEALPLNGDNDCYLDKYTDDTPTETDDVIPTRHGLIPQRCLGPFSACIIAAQATGIAFEWYDDDDDENGDDNFCPALPAVDDDDLCKGLSGSDVFKDMCRSPFKSKACNTEWQVAVQCAWENFVKKEANETCYFECGHKKKDGAGPRSAGLVAAVVAALCAALVLF